MNSATQTRTRSGFVVCLTNEGYEFDLKPNTIYEIIPDDSLEPEDIRVIDESGEDYIYPNDYFVRVKMSRRNTARFMTVLARHVLTGVSLSELMRILKGKTRAKSKM